MTGREIVDYGAKWARDADVYTQQEAVTGSTFLSTRGGVLAVGDEQMPGNQVCVIILDVMKENTYYTGKFDPDNKAPPICYAFGRDADDMAPHMSMQVDAEYFVPQSATCSACPHNEWGSADTGRGKACQNRRRLQLIPAGYYSAKRGSRDFDLELFTDPKHFASADIVSLKLPVTSGEILAKYIASVAASNRRPPHGVITRLFLEPDPKYQYTVRFEMIEEVSDDLADAIFARHDEAVAAKIQGYQVPQEREVQQTGSLRNVRSQRR